MAYYQPGFYQGHPQPVHQVQQCAQVGHPYEYKTYGSDVNNRRITFFRPSGQPNKIVAKGEAFVQGNWVESSCIQGENINVELLSTSAKARRAMIERQEFENERRQGGQQPMRQRVREECALSDLSEDEQNNLLNVLAPKGSYKIEVINGFGGDPRFEKIKAMSLYDPS